jgi:hypothetical protein
MIDKEYYTEKRTFIFIVMLTLFILSVIPLVEQINNNSILLGDFTYYHLRIADSIIKEGYLDYDKLSYQGRKYVFQPYHLFLAFFGRLIGTDFIYIIIPLLLGVLSVIILYLILKNLGATIIERFWVLIILILSPVFIYLFSVLNQYSLSVSLILFGFYLFLKNKKVLYYLSIPIFVSLVVFGIINVIISLLLILAYSLTHKKKMKLFYFILSIVLVFSGLYYYSLYNVFGLPAFYDIESKNILQQTITELGAEYGIGMFAFLLALLGIIISWKNKHRFFIIYLLTLFLLIFSYHFRYTLFYLIFLISYFGGIGFSRIIYRKWDIILIKRLSILAIISGLLFSTVSYLNIVSKSLPNKNVKESLEWLNSHSEQNDTVLSHYSRGFWIEYFAKRAVVMDSLFTYIPDLKQRFYDSNRIFLSRDLRETKKLLNRYNVTYIFIDEKMKHGLVWQNKKQGLLFLLRNKETFENIYNKNKVEIWKYIGGSSNINP